MRSPEAGSPSGNAETLYYRKNEAKIILPDSFVWEFS